MAKLRKTLPKEFNEFIKTIETSYSEQDIEKCKEFLIKCELDAIDRSFYKLTALHKRIPIELAKWLIERGANVNAANTYGTPLFYHAGYRNPNLDICKLLIDNGADVNAAYFEGKTALFEAAGMGNVDVVKLLLEYGADPYHRTWEMFDDDIPLVFMISHMEPRDEGKADVAELLINAMGGKDKIPAEDWSKAQKCVRDLGKLFEFRKTCWTDEEYIERKAQMDRFYKLFDVEPSKPIVKHDGVSPIIVDTSLSAGKLHEVLWEYLVPSYGKCATVQGEVIRITGCVADEVCRNGGCNWNIEYRKMLYWIFRYLSMGTPLENADIEKASNAITNISDSNGCSCENDTEVLMALAVKWVSFNSSPIPLGNLTY